MEASALIGPHFAAAKLCFRCRLTFLTDDGNKPILALLFSQDLGKHFNTFSPKFHPEKKKKE